MSSRSVIILEIGHDITRAAMAAQRGRGIEVTAAVQFDTPLDYIEDGHILDPDRMAAAVVPKLEEARFRGDQIIFSVVSGKIMNRELTIPKVRRNQLDAVVRNQAEELFPMGIEGMALSYIINSIDKDTNQMHLMVYSMPEDTMKSYYALADAMGLQLKSLDYSGNAVFQVVRKLMPDRNVLVATVGGGASQLTIITENMMQMQRNVGYGLNDVLDAAVDLGIGEDRDAAYELLRSDHYMGTSLDDVPADADESTRIGSDLAFSTRNLLNNISRFIDYFYNTRKDASQGLDQILLLGDAGKVIGLDELIEGELLIRTEVTGDWLEGISYKGSDEQSMIDYVQTLGACIAPVGFITEEQIEINQERARQKSSRRLWMTVALVCVTVIAVSGLAWLVLGWQNRALSLESDRLSYVLQIEAALDQAKVDNAAANQIMAATESDAELTPRIMADLEKDLPSSSVVQNLNVGDGVVSMSITANSKSSAADIIMQIKGLDYIDENTVSVGGLTDSKDDATGAGRVDFTITAGFTSDAADYRDTDSIVSDDSSDSAAGSNDAADTESGVSDDSGDADGEGADQ